MHIGFITSNEGKVKELKNKLVPHGHAVKRISLPYPEVQVDALEEVVQFGLSWILDKLQEPITVSTTLDTELNDIDLILIEDSGLFVHGLNGYPGVYSKFVFMTIGYNGMLQLLKENHDRSAHFESCMGMAVIKRDESMGQNTGNARNTQIINGSCKGVIVQVPRGEHGFGYDPIFQPEGADTTFAEMETEQKNNYSHRGKAVKKLIEFLGSLH